MKKAALSLALSAVFLAGCAQVPPPNEPVPAEQMRVIDPPENGWTAQELMSVTYFEGMAASYPLTMEAFGSGYTIYDPAAMATIDVESEHPTIWICDHKGTWGNMFYYTTLYSRDELKSFDSKTKIYNLTASIDADISVNGAKKTSSREELFAALGQPDNTETLRENYTLYTYYVSGTKTPLLEVTEIYSPDNDSYALSGVWYFHLD